MQGFGFRSVVLIAVLLIGASLVAVTGGPRPAGNPRWPTADALFAVGGWTAGPESVSYANGATFVSRTFVRPDAAPSTLTMVTNTSPKLFVSGVEVPFLGTGYDVSPVDGRQALIASRGSERWLVEYGYGERRGLVGSGFMGWGLALFDGVFGRSNDYYKLYLTTALSDNDSAQQSVELADTLFPRIANWYAG
jgi:hypothetical protein